MIATSANRWRIWLVTALMAGAGACDPFHTGFEDDEYPLYYSASSIAAPEGSPQTLLVMDWNIKFGGGRIDFFFDCYGNRVLMSRGEVVSHLQGIADKINQVKPDILLLQEVDINAKRSTFVDQVQWLLDHTELNYGVYASHWRADFIPSDGLGAMDSGNAILSRWPFGEAERIPLALRSDQSSLTRYFYLKRNILRAEVVFTGRPSIEVLNLHAAAYSQDGTKKKHIDTFKSWLDAVDAAGTLLIGGGDLNTIPPGSQQISDFDDSVCTDEEFIADDFSEEVEWLVPFYAAYQPAIDLAVYQANNAPYFSHTTNKDGFWNRKLDYLFTNGTWQIGSGLVHQDVTTGEVETMPLSDHAPLTAVLVLR